MTAGPAFEGFIHRDVPVAGSTMHCVEGGSGRPVVFLHGNPTSSYLWRHVLPRLAGPGRRLIAVDLIGMGRSGKPPLDYTLRDHADHLAGFVEALALTGIVFVAHDWGVALSLDHLRRHPGRVAAVAFMEGHVRGLPSWDAFDPGGRELFRQLRTPGVGERMALTENFLVETLLPAALGDSLTAADLGEYRRPYPDPASRRPLLQWTRQIPVAGEPAEAAAILDAAWANLAAARVPKLLLRGAPGAVIDAGTAAWCGATVPDLEVATVGAAGHFLPEERPAELAGALSTWLESRSSEHREQGEQ